MQEPHKYFFENERNTFKELIFLFNLILINNMGHLYLVCILIVLQSK